MAVETMLNQKDRLEKIARIESSRILREYEKRSSTIAPEYYSLERPENFFIYQRLGQKLLFMLMRAGAFPLRSKRVLDVGCGDGQFLLDLESLGAKRQNLAGIDLIASRVANTRSRLSGGADIREGDASRLPWHDATFDLVHQGTVFSSVLDLRVRQLIAREMLRVTKPGGYIIWYDLKVNNPRNNSVRAVRASEIKRLFLGCKIALKSVTLAPPLSRLIVPRTWIGAAVLEEIRLLNTHYLGLIQKPVSLSS